MSGQPSFLPRSAGGRLLAASLILAICCGILVRFSPGFCNLFRPATMTATGLRVGMSHPASCPLPSIVIRKIPFSSLRNPRYFSQWKILNTVTLMKDGRYYNNGVCEQGIFTARNWKDRCVYLWSPEDSREFIRAYHRLVAEIARRDAEPDLLKRYEAHEVFPANR